ncbi:MAG: hypothetical protein AAFQ58_19290 [Pseudomonadota bacterium]
MRTIGLISDDKKLGSHEHQRGQIGPVDMFVDPDDSWRLWKGVYTVEGAGDVLVVSHARALGRYRRGFALRDERLRLLSSWGVAVQIGKDGDAVTYDDAEKIAAFHAAALEPTGQATPKQKRNPGRPSTYQEPQGEKREMALQWWAGALHTDDVCKLIGQMMNTKTPSRALVAEWLGNRPKFKGRMRKERSDKKT